MQSVIPKLDTPHIFSPKTSDDKVDFEAQVSIIWGSGRLMKESPFRNTGHRVEEEEFSLCSIKLQHLPYNVWPAPRSLTTEPTEQPLDFQHLDSAVQIYKNQVSVVICCRNSCHADSMTRGISSWSDRGKKTGERDYQRVCPNCAEGFWKSLAQGRQVEPVPYNSLEGGLILPR